MTETLYVQQGLMDRNTEIRMLRECSRYVSMRSGLSGEYVGLRDLDGNTLLHSAVSRSNADLALALLLGGADVNASNDNAKTPLDFAVDGKHPMIGKLLLGAGGRLDSAPSNWLELCSLTHSSPQEFTSLPNYFEPWWCRQGSTFEYPDRPLSVSVVGAGPAGLVAASSSPLLACVVTKWLLSRWTCWRT